MPVSVCRPQAITNNSSDSGRSNLKICISVTNDNNPKNLHGARIIKISEDQISYKNEKKGKPVSLIISFWNLENMHCEPNKKVKITFEIESKYIIEQCPVYFVYATLGYHAAEGSNGFAESIKGVVDKTVDKKFQGTVTYDPDEPNFKNLFRECSERFYFTLYK